MSADLYSTNPTLFGSALIAGTPILLAYAPAVVQAESVAPYFSVGAGMLFVCLALSITGGVQSLAGMMRFCSTVGALACAFAAWRFWKEPYYVPLAVACAVAVPVFLLWGWGQAWRMDRAKAAAKDRGSEQQGRIQPDGKARGNAPGTAREPGERRS